MLAPEEEEVVALGWGVSVAVAAAATAHLAAVDHGTFVLKVVFESLSCVRVYVGCAVKPV